MSKVQGAEIFATGTWNGMAFKEADLDAMVASFDKLALSGRVPLKFGHNNDQKITDGQPAIGWVERIWRDGGKLLADFADVPQTVLTMIRNRLYKFVSVELLEDAERDGEHFPWVLSAVALLGADVPAVGSLAELSKLIMSRRAAFQFSRAGNLNLEGGQRDMSDDKLADALAKVATLEAKVATFTDQTKVLNDALEAERKANRNEKAAALKAQAEQKFEAAIAAKRLLPSVRERFFKWTFPKESDDVLTFDLGEVDKVIKEHETQVPTSKGGSKARDDEEGLDHGTVVANRTHKYMAENKVTDYKAAMLAVLREDPELAEAYRYMPEKAAARGGERS